jgi:uncharacterized coiled-coil protein SlyX
MDWGNIAQVASALVAITALAISVISAGRRPMEGAIREVADDVDEMDKAIAQLTVRVGSIERDVEHLPDVSSSHRLEIAMEQMRAELAVMAEKLKPVAAISDRLQEFLLEQARGK